MLTARRLSCFLLVAFHTIGHAASIEGDWEYIGKTLDAVYGEPESLHLAIRIDGKTLCGSYMSAYRGGMKVVEGTFQGKITGNKAAVVYVADSAEPRSTGKATLRLIGSQLDWVVTQKAPESEYVIQAAVLHRASARLERPKPCEK